MGHLKNTVVRRQQQQGGTWFYFCNQKFLSKHSAVDFMQICIFNVHTIFSLENSNYTVYSPIESVIDTQHCRFYSNIPTFFNCNTIKKLIYIMKTPVTPQI